MAVKPAEKRTRRLPFWVFLVYGLLALFVAVYAFNVVFGPRYDPCRPDGFCYLIYVPSAVPFGLPTWVFQVLFEVTALSGLASIVRWVAGIITRK
jgi:hypothetical protein